MLLTSLTLLATLVSCTSSRGAQRDREEEETPDGGQCQEGFAAVRQQVEAAPPEARVIPALSGIALACPGVLGELAEAAAKTEGLSRPERAAVLAQTASLALPPACTTTTPLAPAATVVWSCPPPEQLQLAEPLLQDLDTGTYLYVLAVRARLDNAGEFSEDMKRVLDNLLMAAALEGEAARGGAAATETPPL